MYKFIIEDHSKFIDEASLLFTQTANTESNYYERRDEFNQSTCEFRKACLFLYLNRHGYNGLVRYNSQGGFNVPHGRYKKIKFPESEIIQFANKLKGATFTCMSFEDCFKSKERKGATYFCDPPYVPLKKTSNFVSYAPCAFGPVEHALLNSYCADAAQKGNTAYVCNHRVPLVNEIYTNFDSSVNYFARRRIASIGHKRKRVKETLMQYEAVK